MYGGGGVVVDGIEVVLFVYQYVVQGEWLGYVDNGVVYSGIVVGVIFINYIIYYMGGFFIGFILVVVEFVYGEQYVVVYWFEVVVYIWQSLVYDYVYGVIQV